MPLAAGLLSPRWLNARGGGGQGCCTAPHAPLLMLQLRLSWRLFVSARAAAGTSRSWTNSWVTAFSELLPSGTRLLCSCSTRSEGRIRAGEAPPSW